MSSLNKRAVIVPDSYNDLKEGGEDYEGGKEKAAEVETEAEHRAHIEY